MDIISLIRSLEKTTRIHRNGFYSWYIYDFDKQIITSSSGTPVLMQSRNFLADDWEVYQEELTFFQAFEIISKGGKNSVKITTHKLKHF